MDKQQFLKKIQLKLNDKFSKYVGLSFPNVARSVGINPDTLKSKLSTVQLLKKMMEYENFNVEEIILKNNIDAVSLKTVRLKCDGKPKESMSFEQIKFNDLSKEIWNTSKLREKFLLTTFIFAVFEYDNNVLTENNLYFKGFYLWQMPTEILDKDIKDVWETTKSLINEGLEIIEQKKGNKIVQTNNLPGQRFNGIAHVRPKASSAADKVLLPNGMLITKQAFWLNAEYIAKIILEMPKIKIKKQNDGEIMLLDNPSIEQIRQQLIQPIYTYDDFNSIANTIVDNFDKAYFNQENIASVGYNMHPNFVLIRDIHRPEDYFEHKIFEQDYFTKIIDPIYDSPQFNRKLGNLEDSLDLVKIEQNTYITITKLNQAGIGKGDLIGFKKSVENFVKNGQLFTWKSIENEGFHHSLVDFGFQDIFYESLLKTPGALKYIKVSNSTIFEKSIDLLNLDKLFINILDGHSSFTLNEIVEKFKILFNFSINIENIIYYAKQSNLYFSEDLERLFIDRNSYYQYIE